MHRNLTAADFSDDELKILKRQGLYDEETGVAPGLQRLDETKKVVTGSCDHFWSVDEELGEIRHVVCDRCGFGKYTNKEVHTGSFVGAEG